MTAALPPAGAIQYGRSSLSDVLPSALAALAVPGRDNALGLEPTDCLVLFLVDGLGWNLLRRHADRAPFLASLAGIPLTAGFPTTTVASIASIGTGLPSGQHGLTGYTSGMNGLGEPVNWLRWRSVVSGRDLIDDLVPEQAQPARTIFEEAHEAGVTVSVVSARAFRDSGFTRAVLRGGAFLPVFTAADTVTTVASAATGPRPALIYCYNPELDLIGHMLGCESEAWAVQLSLIDRAAELIAQHLPPDATLLVTGDHGMVDVPDDAKIDYDAEPVLSAEVEMLAGEARNRYVHVAAGAAERVRERWRQRLADRMAILTRDEAIARGWFGPTVTPAAYQRIGDLVAVATGNAAVVQHRVAPRTSSLIGQHGALTDDELLVPLLRLR